MEDDCSRAALPAFAAIDAIAVIPLLQLAWRYSRLSPVRYATF